MRKKVSCFSTRVWAGFLALLGFASCTSNEDPEDYGWFSGARSSNRLGRQSAGRHSGYRTQSVQ